MTKITRSAFLFLLIIFAIIFGGCQAFAPDAGGDKLLSNNNNGIAKQTGFFESAKRLFMPDFGDGDNVADKKIASRNLEHPHQSAQKNTSNYATSNYAYGNSLSANRQPSAISPSNQLQPSNFLYSGNINFNPLNNSHLMIDPYFNAFNIVPFNAPPQNNLATKNTDAINTNVAAENKQNSTSAASNIEPAITPDQIVAKNENAKNADENIKPNNKSEKINNNETNVELTANKTKTIKKYTVDPLLPQKNDSENFRLFLDELATIPADKLKVDETELAERIEAFRTETAAVNSANFETIAIGNLRADILPESLISKKTKDKKNQNAAVKSALTANKKNGIKSSWKPEIEQIAFADKHDAETDDIYCNDNSGAKSKVKLDDKNAPLPLDIQSSGGVKKRNLSKIQTNGINSTNYKDKSTAVDSLASSQYSQYSPPPSSLPNSPPSLPHLPQITGTQPTPNYHNNFSPDNQFDKTNFDKKFVSYYPNQFGQPDQPDNIVMANYTSSNQNPIYPQVNYLSNNRQSSGAWETHVRNAISQLRREMETSQGTILFSDDVKLRLLELALGNRDGAVKPFRGVEKPVNEFWADQMLGLATIMDVAEVPDRIERFDLALLRFDGGVLALRQLCPLKLKNLQLIQHDNKNFVTTYGNFQKRIDDCKAAEWICIYLELENPTIKNTSDGYYVQLAVVCEIFDAASNLVQKKDMGTVQDISSVQKHDHFIKMVLNLKKNLSPGQYKLSVKITDLNSPNKQKLAEEQTTFKIIP
ncbi:MAG: hypothetical protein LBP59_17180 [Planctomycetaceae bacterium]|jgi:hypothetical protein|nr:hypothetical protein [Planctomycetaceae bacterium]